MSNGIDGGICNLAPNAQPCADLATKITPRPAMDVVVMLVARQLGVRVSSILGKDKFRKYTEARHMAWWIHCRVVGESYPMMGREYGVHHTSVMSGCQRMDDRVWRDLELLAHARAIVEQLGLKFPKKPYVSTRGTVAAE